MITIEHRKIANRAADAYFQGDDPRSHVYQNGFRSVVAWWAAGAPQNGLDPIPHRPRTPEADAWRAGAEAGKKVISPWHEANLSPSTLGLTE